MNDSTDTTSASVKTNPTKVVLRALTWAAETSISGSGDYHCVSFFCFPLCFLVSPQLHRFTVLPSWKEGNVHALCKVSHQLACSSRCRLAAVLHVAQRSTPWSHALCSSGVHLCLVPPFPLQCVSHIHLQCQVLALLPHSGPRLACCCYRLPFQSHLSLCRYTPNL